MKKIGFLLLLAGAMAVSAQTPPPLPGALGGGVSAPSLPSGLGGLPSSKGASAPQSQASLPVTGFVEVRLGQRLKASPGFSDSTLAEARLQLDWQEEILDGVSLAAAVDLLADGVASGRSFDWEKGDGWFDARSLNIAFSPLAQVDLKLGRQVATWGVGDLLFINDLFPKDWNAFFLGRDLEYLKAPQDSARVSYYSDLANFDLVYSPRFEPDRFIDGERLSFWDAASGAISTVARPMAVEIPGDSLEEDELHLRVSRMIGRFEASFYGYRGFWKSPAGVDLESGRALFPRLDVWGVSARGPLGKGILSAEWGAYDSRDDRSGSDPTIRNSELRLLLGYEQEIGNEFTGSVQYYVERTRDWLASGSGSDRDRDLVTLRLRKMLWRQTLTLNGFVFYSPSQEDRYLRLSASWQASDDWRFDLGANLFGGEASSFFGQFDGNENAYLAVRRSF